MLLLSVFVFSELFVISIDCSSCFSSFNMLILLMIGFGSSIDESMDESVGEPIDESVDESIEFIIFSI